MDLDIILYWVFSLLGQSCFVGALFGNKEKSKERLLYAIYFRVVSVMYRLILMSRDMNLFK